MKEKNVAELCTFILGSLKDEEGGRVALYHYIKNTASPESPATPALINEFYGEALQLQHWRDRKIELHEDMQEPLQWLASQYSQTPFRIDLVWDLEKIQLVRLERPESLSQTVNDFESSRQMEGERLRILQEGFRSIAVKRHANGTFTVRTYGPVVSVQGSRLVPVGVEQEIHYDAGLELMTGAPQKLRPSPNSQIRFTVTAEGVSGQLISGYAFRQAQAFNLHDIREEARLFYPLKRLERFYVHRPSDPYYMEIISMLDRAMESLRQNAPEARETALRAFDSGQIAFDQIFPDDKALYTRLRELARRLTALGKPARGAAQRPGARNIPEV